ncbi:aminoglycoside phosphotransferase [Arthrobacter psychrolactophilus]|uniref:Aminoglycoside phosphotransferase n=1 Tax=Arthrobacter psychrolactophilus TaxID=92442 RepID=A0A2V5IPD2_9MICC|nr:phosphotransferase [Arthrobacter psychrolactophilus]PYI38458.1 aminoglycoside phosphotransferase [Arthrobacter psychrolactophilus]
MEEILLVGGNASDDVVRVGSTVRKPWTAATPSVLAYMHAVREAGVDVPAVHGRDAQGRQMTEFIPGGLAMDSEPLSLSELCRVGRIVRAIHDASAAYKPDSEATWSALIPAPGAELICHNDLAPWNLIIGERWVFIDWDAAAPSTRLWDLAYAAQTFTLNDASADPRVAARALAAFIDGYGADDELRAALPVTMWQRTAAMHELLKNSHVSGIEPWATMFTSGHGDHWLSVTQFVRNNEPVWAEAVQIAR